MIIKVQTCFFIRLFFVPALLLLSVGNYSFAQTSFSATAAPDSMSVGSSDIPPPQEGQSGNNFPELSRGIPSETILTDSLSIRVNEVPADTSDSTTVKRESKINLEGREGWYLINAPTQSLSFSDLLHSVWVQGISDSNDPVAAVPTILSWSETNSGFTEKPTTMAGTMEAGKGYAVYFFADDNPSEQGVQGGFPKKIIVKGEEVNEPVTVEVFANDINENDQIDSGEGWNLLGNPFNVELSVEKVKSVFRSASDSLNEYIYVWNSMGNRQDGSFKALGNSDVIAPYEVFFVKFLGSSEVDATVELSKEELIEKNTSPAYRHEMGTEFSLDFNLTNGEKVDQYEIAFSNQGSMQLNRFDAHKLFSLNTPSLHLFGQKGDGIIQKNTLPAEFTSAIEIPVDFEYEREEELTLNWENVKSLPHEWTLTLRDMKNNVEIDLRTNREYRFVNEVERGRQAVIPAKVERPQIIRDKQSLGSERFILSINPGLAKTVAQENPESIKLKPNYPNPFNQETTISYELSEEMEVTLSIWNMIGQKVATLVDDFVEAGSHEERWIASQMPSGMYIARLEVGNQVFTRKMTLIK